MRFAPSDRPVQPEPLSAGMKVILDTNILVSALLTRRGSSARLLDAWIERRFELVTSAIQIAELVDVTRRRHIRPLIIPAVAGRFVNDLRRHATMLGHLPSLSRWVDSGDDFLLAMAEVSEAQFLVTGDKRDLLALAVHGRTQIVTARFLLQTLKIV
ncbi:MAG: putative toxin-antitoxin system toxin component, PIN family [Steroidobacteraceae bacterium]